MLNRLDIDRCPEMDSNRDGRVQISELIGVAGQALHGCYHDNNHCGSPGGPIVDAIECLLVDTSCEEDEQCERVSIGANPCGGPRRIEYFSTKNTDPDELFRFVGIHNASEQAGNRRSRCLGLCQRIRRPMPVCRGGFCVAP